MRNGYEIAKLLKGLDVCDTSPVFQTNRPGFTADQPLGIFMTFKNQWIFEGFPQFVLANG